MNVQLPIVCILVVKGSWTLQSPLGRTNHCLPSIDRKGRDTSMATCHSWGLVKISVMIKINYLNPFIHWLTQRKCFSLAQFYILLWSSVQPIVYSLKVIFFFVTFHAPSAFLFTSIKYICFKINSDVLHCLLVHPDRAKATSTHKIIQHKIT